MTDEILIMGLKRKYGRLAGELRQVRKQASALKAVRNAELARRLTEMGLPETEASVQVKINRGAFPAWFLFAALRAIGVGTLRLE